MCRKLILVACALLLVFTSPGQLPGEQKLKEQIQTAPSDEVRVQRLGELAELYSAFRDNRRADSVVQRQLSLTETLRNNDLLVRTLSTSAIENIAAWSSKETFDRATAFLQRNLAFAKESNHTQLEAVIHLKLAHLFRKRRLHDQALEQATLVLLLTDRKQDSLRSIVHLELGEAFLGKGDAVSAYKNFNSAYDLAYSLRNVPLQSAAWHAFSTLYLSLGDSLLGKKSLLESLALNQQHGQQAGKMNDYIDLFRLTDEPDVLEKAMQLAVQLGSVRHQLLCKQLMLSYLMVVEKDSGKAFAYLAQNPDLQLYQANKGLPNYNTGAIYHYSGQYAKAIEHYRLDEQLIVTGYDPQVQLAFFGEMAHCYQQLNKIDEAISYYEKAYNLGQTIGSPAGNAALTLKLSQLFAQRGRFEQAYAYNLRHLNHSEALKNQAKQREVTLLGLEREKKKHEKDLQAAAQDSLKRRNLQYTGISLVIAFLFIILLVFGMFPVSKTTIRMLNFFSFICLFEFIILLIDNWLHHVSHGEPLKIWLAKIFIIALLLPLHHTLEHVAIRFLSSQKLQHFRQRISVYRLLHPSRRSVQKLEDKLEESTLV